MSIKIDISVYERQRKPVQDFLINQARGDAGYAISSLASSAMIPCIVSACFIGEKVGFDEKLTNTIKGLIKFYGYTEILNGPENLPKDLFKS